MNKDLAAQAQVAAINDLFGQSHCYQQAATIKNGLPEMPIRQWVGLGVNDPPADAPAPTAPAATAPAATSPLAAVATKTGMSWGKIAGLVGLATGLAGTGGLGGYLLSLPHAPTVPAPAPSSVVQKADGDLMNWLKGNGYNAPSAAGGQP